MSGQLTSSCYLYSPSQYTVLDILGTIKHSNFQIILGHHEVFLSHPASVRKGSLYEGSDRLLKADGSTNIHNNPWMSCGAIGKQKYTDSTLLEPTEAGKFEAVAITFKMDAKKNDRNEHEQKKRPLTSTPLCSRPHSPHSFLFSQPKMTKIILLLCQY